MVNTNNVVQRVILEVAGTIATHGIQSLCRESQSGMDSFTYVRGCLVSTAYNGVRALPGFSMPYGEFFDAVLKQADKDLLPEVRTLRCTSCGERFQGRQFHNQDTGHGMGPCCAERVLHHRPFGQDAMSLAEFERCYGVRGIHFDIPAEQTKNSAE